MGPLQIFIIDDDYYVRQATTSLLTRDERTQVIGSAASIAEAWHDLKAWPADLILLDLDFKHTGESGLDAIAALKTTFPQTKILILSGSRDEHLVLATLQAGADGYIWKNDAAEGLGSAIERVSEGNFVVTASVARLVFGKISSLLGERPAEVLPEGKRYRKLTRRIEQAMKLYCIDNLSALEIAETLDIAENTVRGYLKKGYQVIGVSSRREAFQKLIARADE
jgi:DNA-binding NarL/FixJ family response regulator